MVLYRFLAGDGASRMTVTLFNNRFLAAKIRPRKTYLFHGLVTGGFTRREMASPQIEEAPAEGGLPRLRPVYRQTEGLSSRVIEGCVRQALERLEQEPPADPPSRRPAPGGGTVPADGRFAPYPFPRG